LRTTENANNEDQKLNKIPEEKTENEIENLTNQ
jgi:hypothetical protein